MSFAAKIVKGVFGLGKKAPTAAPAPVAEGPKTTMLTADETARANVRKKRPPLSAGNPTIIGSDKLGAGVLNGTLF